MFKRDHYVKIVDTCGNFRFGYISEVKDRGGMLVVDLMEEGLNKIGWDSEYALNVGNDVLVKDFNKLLTDTEKKMIPLLAQNQTTGDMAGAMNIAPVTVRAHIRDLKIKLGVDTREQLFAYAQGIIKVISEPG